MITFISVIGLIIIGNAVILLAMWSQNQFTGQKLPSEIQKQTILWMVRLGLAIGGWRILMSVSGSSDEWEWIAMAFSIGALITAAIAFNEKYESRKKYEQEIRIPGGHERKDNHV